MLQITDAANEAKDNVKYLATLEKSMEPMYMGTPHSIQESLPTLINNIKMMHTIARYYNTSERMTVLFQKVTNQMVKNCKEHILSPGKLWDQDKVILLQNLTAAVHLNEAYQEQYRLKRDKVQVTRPCAYYVHTQLCCFHRAPYGSLYNVTVIISIHLA